MSDFEADSIKTMLSDCQHSLVSILKSAEPDEADIDNVLDLLERSEAMLKAPPPKPGLSKEWHNLLDTLKEHEAAAMVHTIFSAYDTAKGDKSEAMQAVRKAAESVLVLLPGVHSLSESEGRFLPSHQPSGTPAADIGQLLLTQLSRLHQAWKSEEWWELVVSFIQGVWYARQLTARSEKSLDVGTMGAILTSLNHAAAVAATCTHAMLRSSKSGHSGESGHTLRPLAIEMAREASGPTFSVLISVAYVCSDTFNVDLKSNGQRFLYFVQNVFSTLNETLYGLVSSSTAARVTRIFTNVAEARQSYPPETLQGVVKNVNGLKKGKTMCRQDADQVIGQVPIQEMKGAFQSIVSGWTGTDVGAMFGMLQALHAELQTRAMRVGSEAPGSLLATVLDAVVPKEQDLSHSRPEAATSLRHGSRRQTPKSDVAVSLPSQKKRKLPATCATLPLRDRLENDLTTRPVFGDPIWYLLESWAAKNESQDEDLRQALGSILCHGPDHLNPLKNTGATAEEALTRVRESVCRSVRLIEVATQCIESMGKDFKMSPEGTCAVSDVRAHTIAYAGWLKGVLVNLRRNQRAEAIDRHLVGGFPVS